MDRQSLRVLEYPHILTVLEALATTEPGRQAVRELRPSAERELIAAQLGQVTELKNYLQGGNFLPLAGIEAVSATLDRVSQTGQVIAPENLLKVASTLAATRLLRRLADQLPSRASRLGELLARLEPVPELEMRIGRAIDGRGKIRDDASPTLSRLRTEITRLREHLHTELTGILERQAAQKTLQDKLITIRNGRLVIPVRSGARGAVEGIVHDTSQSGATSFVEPLAVVPLNNQLSRARSLEQEEEARILRELTEAVMDAGEVLRTNERWLGEIDRLYAKVRLSLLLAAREPVLNNVGRIRLLQAIHPILALQRLAREGDAVPASLAEILWGEGGAAARTAPRAVVPIDIHLSREQSTLIISGANAGGKTVSLKTLGLLGAMVQTGLHIPVAEGSEWPVLTGIFAEIGDEQDLRAHLSTFSARIQRLAAILGLADHRSLVLLDELGTGTDPAEGAALGLAVLDGLRSRSALVAVTTHYHLIKAYGMVEEGVVNAAVEFDERSGRPTYCLRYGHPGTSNALKIAADLAMPPEVIQATGRYLNRDEQRTNELIEKLEEARRGAERGAAELMRQRQELEAARVELGQERGELVRSRAQILGEARQQAERLIAEAERELKEAVIRFQEQGSSGAATARRRVQKIKATLKTVLEPEATRRDPALTRSAEGRLVKIRGAGGTGMLLEVKDEGRRASIQLGPKRVEVDASALELLPAHQEQGGSGGTGGNGVRALRDDTEGWQDRLTLVGLRVDEALPLLDKAIDQAILQGRAEIEVVHGHGTGRLRKAVHEFLLNHGGVKGFHHEVQNRGGSGVTVVELK